ncbi:peptidase inhibitor I9 [Kineococcus xinjiangensis]|uniref:Peptidase inhibitor I9 n=1 Tax=Kineococcus xinjiangensis TaxID=512762 RepID=A0A2S6ISW6_9ACTN|nr:S8 family peptidase [Kineococcus xinjiangensis]PPK97339.1 peptidase inhibitor I9 [Kineococcus xinjiangensis]
MVAIAWGAGALLAAAPLTSAAASPADPAPREVPVLSSFEDGHYVVTLTGAPLAEYQGGVAGIPVPKAAPDGRPNMKGPVARQYRRHLERRQSDVAASVGASPDQRYTVALNGFAAELSAVQAQKLAGHPGVLSVVPDTLRQVQTTTTPEYLGLTGSAGVWAELGGQARAGEGVVVGILDTGLWPENPAFAGAELPEGPTPGKPFLAHRGEDGRIVQQKRDGGTFTGVCEEGERWSETTCSTKVIGARYFAEGFLRNVDEEDLVEVEYLSPRDGHGHGSHTAATAAGKDNIPVVLEGEDFGSTSGMAPGASLAVYKVCWTATAASGCATSDSVAAIDAAVEDGVDVINYSIGGGAATTVADPVELAFLSAASAGIFVATSAGNAGPEASTLDHASPWLTTVAAATAVPREGTVLLGDGRRFVGGRLSGRPMPAAPLVLSTDVKTEKAKEADARLCKPGTLDPAEARGKVVLCYRGENPRVEKSAEVARAGGVGMVLVNPTPSSVDADVHLVPTVHLDAAAGKEVVAYAEQPGATVAFEGGNTTGIVTPTPQIAGFSSRGPTLASDGDVLKPDIAAPGVGILAAVAPQPGNGENDFGGMSGTSMASPHIAGLAALIFHRYPNWSPMAVKSAMMTTARDLVRADGTPERDAFAGGAGFVAPRRFLDPGLVYDSGPEEWIAFMEGSGIDTGTGLGAIDPSDLNQPSIAIGELVGTQTVTRRVTAVSPGLYFARASVPGMRVRVSPSVLHFNAPGETKTFKVTFTTTRKAELAEYAGGFLTWRGAGTTVRSPIAVRPLPLDAPEEVRGSGAEGSVTVPVAAGTTGEVELDPLGMVPGDVERGRLERNGTRFWDVDIEPGTEFARFEVLAEDQRGDFDLALFRLGDDGEEELVRISASASADERIDLVAPEPGTYMVLVMNFANPPGQSSNGFEQATFLVNSASVEGSLEVEPNPLALTSGRVSTYEASWSGLDPEQRYLGIVDYVLEDSEIPLPPTVVAVG